MMMPSFWRDYTTVVNDAIRLTETVMGVLESNGANMVMTALAWNVMADSSSSSHRGQALAKVQCR